MRISIAVCGLVLSSLARGEGSGEDWPQWRGPAANGVAASAAPTEWSEDEGLRWKVDLPGVGSSTPIVFGSRVYVTTAIPTERRPDGAKPAKAADEPAQAGGRGRRRRPEPLENIYEFVVVALDRADGKEVWRSKVAETVPHEPGHSTNTQASASPVTDGEHIWAFFGSRGMHCLDMNGKLVWSKDFGQMQTRNQFGEGASPALEGDVLVMVWDHEGEDFIVALNKHDGEELWLSLIHI